MSKSPCETCPSRRDTFFFHESWIQVRTFLHPDRPSSTENGSISRVDKCLAWRTSDPIASSVTLPLVKPPSIALMYAETCAPSMARVKRPAGYERLAIAMESPEIEIVIADLVRANTWGS